MDHNVGPEVSCISSHKRMYLAKNPRKTSSLTHPPSDSQGLLPTPNPLKMSTLSFTKSRYIHEEHYYIAKMDRNDTSIGLDSGANSTSPPRCALDTPVGLDSAVPVFQPRGASSMPVGLDGAMNLSRLSHRRYVWPVGLDNAAKLSPSREDGAKPNPLLKGGAERIGLAAAVRQNNIGQRPFGPYVCREWEKCWFCTEYVEPPRHERRRSDSEASVRERRKALSKRGKALHEQREAADAVKKQEKKNKQKQLWIERQLQGFKLAAKNMRGGTR
jgi:hypothetical protein